MFSKKQRKASRYFNAVMRSKRPTKIKSKAVKQNMINNKAKLGVKSAGRGS